MKKSITLVIVLVLLAVLVAPMVVEAATPRIIEDGVYTLSPTLHIRVRKEFGSPTPTYVMPVVQRYLSEHPNTVVTYNARIRVDGFKPKAGTAPR